MNILFFGTPSICVPTLKALHQHHTIVGVVCPIDKPRGRGQKLSPCDVKQCALELDLPVFQPEKLTDTSFLEQIKSLQIDIGLVFAFKKLPREVYTLPKLGTFNIHTSLLPNYRGAAPIQWAIINGEKQTGMTSFLLNDTIDAGDILVQKTIDISLDMTAGQLHDTMMDMAPELALDTITGLENGTLKPIHQDTTETTPAPKLFKEDCKIRWDLPCEKVYNHIRGLSPFPAAYGSFQLGDKVFECKFYEVDFDTIGHSKSPGEAEIVGKALWIYTKNGVIKPQHIKPQNKKLMDITSFINGLSN